jgi:hypothetical protein
MATSAPEKATEGPRLTTTAIERAIERRLPMT